MIEESDCEYEEGSHVASYDENYIPAANDGTDTPKDSNIEQEMIIEQKEYDSNESVEDEPVSHNVSSIWTARTKQNGIATHYQAHKQDLVTFVTAQ